MTDPVQGIKAVPDDNNARYFHVVVAGPKDVGQSLSLIVVVDRLSNKSEHE